MVYPFLETITAKDEASLALILEAIQPLVTVSSTKELGTLSYEVVRPEEETSPTITIIGRYSNQAARQTHSESVESVNFRKWFADNREPLGLKTTFQSFTEPTSKKNVEQTGTPSSEEVRPDGVLVFCGSAEGNDPIYKAKAVELGKLMAEQKKLLIYGGGTTGLMGALAKTCHNNGGKVLGIIPRALIPRERSVEEEALEHIFVDTMAIRKSKMFELSGTVISMPGGLGTFDELLEVLTLFQLNAYRPKIGLLNVEGFYDPFLKNLDAWIQAGFVNADAKDYMVVHSDPDELLRGLETHVPPASVRLSGIDLKWTAKP